MRSKIGPDVDISSNTSSLGEFPYVKVQGKWVDPNNPNAEIVETSFLEYVTKHECEKEMWNEISRERIDWRIRCAQAEKALDVAVKVLKKIKNVPYEDGSASLAIEALAEINKLRTEGLKDGSKATGLRGGE